MSQYILDTTHHGRRIRVMMGSDRPLQYVLMTVEDIDADEAKDDDVYLYSNLNQPDCDSLTVDDFRAVLQKLDIPVWEVMFTETENDQVNNVGNRVVHYAAPGLI